MRQAMMMLLVAVLFLALSLVLAITVFADCPEDRVEVALDSRAAIVYEQSINLFAPVWAEFEKSERLTSKGKLGLRFGSAPTYARALAGMTLSWTHHYLLTGDTKDVSRVNWLLTTLSKEKYHSKYAYMWDNMWTLHHMAYVACIMRDELSEETVNSTVNMLVSECDELIRVIDLSEEEPLASVDDDWTYYDGTLAEAQSLVRGDLLYYAGDSPNADRWKEDTRAETTAGWAALLAQVYELTGNVTYRDYAQKLLSLVFVEGNIDTDYTVFNHGYGPNYAYAAAAVYSTVQAQFTLTSTVGSDIVNCIITRNMDDMTNDGVTIDQTRFVGDLEAAKWEHTHDWLTGDLRYNLTYLPYFAILRDDCKAWTEMLQLIDALSKDPSWYPVEIKDVTHSAIPLIHNLEFYSQLALKFRVLVNYALTKRTYARYDSHHLIYSMNIPRCLTKCR